MSILDIDGNGQQTVTDGRLIFNYLAFANNQFVPVAPLLESIVNESLTQDSVGATRLTGEALVAHIDEVKAQFDIDGNGQQTVTDGRLIFNYFAFANNQFVPVAPLLENIVNESLTQDSVGATNITADILQDTIEEVSGVIIPDGDSLLNPSLVSQELSSFFSSLNTGFTNISPQINLPIIGEAIDQLNDGSIDFENIGNTIVQDFAGLATETATREIEQKLDNIPGLNATILSENQDQIIFSLDYQKSLETEVSLFSEGGGLSDFIDVSNGLNPQVSLDVSFGFSDLQFGVNSNGAFLDQSSSGLEIDVNFDLPNTIPDGLKLGFLDVGFSEPVGGNDFSVDVKVDLDDFSYDVNYTDLSVIDLFRFDVTVPDGVIDVPGIGEIRFGFPEISGQVELDFNALDADADVDLGFPFKLSDITLDVDSIIGNLVEPFLSPIQELIQPLREVADILYAPVPILNDLATAIPEVLNALDRGGNINGPVEISLRDILEIGAEAKQVDVNFEFFDQGLQVLGILNDLQVSKGLIPLGDLGFYQGNINEQPNQDTLSVIESDLPEGFNIPLLEDPVGSVFGFLLGSNPIDLINYSTPRFEFEGTINEVVPILGPLGVSVGGRFDIEAQFSFGYDTNGLETGFLEDGFYIADSVNGEDIKEVEFGIGPRFGPGVQVGVASLEVNLGYGGGISLDFNDSDGQLRLSELGDRLASRPFELFDVGIDLSAGFGGSFSLAGVTLFRPEINGSIQIAEISGTEIQNTADNIFSAGKKAADFISRIYDIFDSGINLDAVGEFANFLIEEVGFMDAASVIWNTEGLLKDTFQFADVLLNKTSAGFRDVAIALSNIVGRNAPEIFADIVVGAGASIFNGAKALWDGEIVADTFELADVLWNQTSADLRDVAIALSNIVGRNAPEIFADIVVGAGASIFNGAKALWDGEIVADTFELADVLINQTSAGLVDTAFVLRDIVERNAGGIVADIVRGAGLGFFDAGFALWEIGGVISNSRDLISVLNSEGAGFDTLVNVLVDIVEFSHVDATAIVNDFLGIGDGGNLIPGVDVPFVPFI